MFDQLSKQALRHARMLKVMTTSGVIRPYGPVTLAGVGKTHPGLGDRLRRWHRGPGDPLARAGRPRRRARRAHLGRARRAGHPAGPRAQGARGRRGRQRRGAVPQPPLLPRRLHRPVQARRRHPLPEHGLLGQAAGRGVRPREAGGDRLRRRVHRADRQVRHRPEARHRLARRGAARHRPGRGPDREGLDGQAPGARAHQPAGDPDLRHHGHAQGRTPGRVGSRRRGRAALEDAVQDQRHHLHRGPAVPHLGLGPPEHGHAARLEDRAAPQVRPGRLPRDHPEVRRATR